MKMNGKKLLVMVFWLLIFTVVTKKEVMAAMAPSSVEYQGNTIVSTYNCNLQAWRGEVGTTEQSAAYQIDLTGVDRIVVDKVTGHGKCGNCNGSSGHAGGSMLVGGIVYGTNVGNRIELSNMEGYGFGVTSVTLYASASVHNTCGVCGRCSTEHCTVSTIRTYATPSGISAQPSDCTAATDGTGSFAATGYKISEYVWQKKENDTYVTLEDGVCENGMSYSGTKTNKLDIAAVRYTANQTVYRCVMKGTDQKEWVSRDALLTVRDCTVPHAVIEMSPAAWTNGEVTLSAAADDLDIGLHETPYSWDGGVSYTDKNSRAFSLNGTYAVTVRDAAGNVFAQNVTINQIDKTVPTLSVSANTAERTTAPVKLFITAEDKESGLHEKAYYYEHTWHMEHEFEADKNGSYEIMVRDAAGNIANICYEVKNIEQVKKPDTGGENKEEKDNNAEEGNNTGGGSGGQGTTANISPPVVITPLPVLQAAAPVQPKKKVSGKNTKNEKEKAKEKEEVKIETEKKLEEKEPVTAAVENKQQAETDNIQTPVLQKEEAKTNKWIPLLIGTGVFLLFLVLLFILFFGVLIETEKQSGTGFKLYAVGILYPYKKNWKLKVKNVWRDYERIRLTFGILFLLLFESWSLYIEIKEETKRELEVEISQKFIVERRQIRRQ